MSDPAIYNSDLVKIDEIVITNASIDNATNFSSLEKGKFFFDTTSSFQVGVNEHFKKIRIIFSCQIETFTNDKDKLAIKGKFDIAFFFIIENFSDLVFLKEDVSVERTLLTSLANIVYATSRGIIYTRCQGTMLKNLVLPILSNERLYELINPEG